MWKDSSVSSNGIEIFLIPVSPFRVSCILCTFVFAYLKVLAHMVTCYVTGVQDLRF